MRFCRHNACTVQLTIRDVPDPVKAALVSAARSRGQSLQAYLLGVLRQQADFRWNADLLVEMTGDLADGVGDDSPRAADVLAQAREERGRDVMR